MKMYPYRVLTVFLVVLFLASTLGYGRQTAEDKDLESYKQARGAMQQARELFEEARYDEARPLLAEAIRLFPQYSDAYFYTAQILYKKGSYDQALQAIVDAESHFNRVLHMEIQIAESDIQRNLIQQERRNYASDMYFVYGNIWLRKKDYKQAHEKYLEAVQYNPRHRQAFNNLINLHLRLGNNDLALELLKRAEESGVSVNPRLKLQTLEKSGELQKHDTWKVTLTNGQNWIGKIVAVEESLLKLQTDLGELEFHKDSIFSIEPYSGEAEEPVVEQEAVDLSTPTPQPFHARKRVRFKKLFFQLDYDFLSHASADYRDVYGSSASFAVLNVGYRLPSGLFLKFAFSDFSQDGEVPQVGIPTQAQQKFWSLVLGYEGKITGRLGYQVEGGAFYTDYGETVGVAELSDHAIGFRLGGNLLLRFADSIYTIVSVGYLNASDTIESKQVKLGGFYTGAGIGLLF